MKQKILLLIAFLFTFQATFSQIKAGRDQSFDTNWKFKKGKEIDAKAVTFNDSNWRNLDVPHDWSIEGNFSKEHPATTQGGALPTGIRSRPLPGT